MKSVKELNVEDFDIEVDEEALEEWKKAYKKWNIYKIIAIIIYAIFIPYVISTEIEYSFTWLAPLIFLVYSFKEEIDAFDATGLKRKDVEEARNR